MAKQKGLGKGLGALLGEESLRADTPRRSGAPARYAAESSRR